MKKQTILAIVSCLLIFGIVESCKSKFDEKEYLTQILNNIEQVKSASYILKITTTAMEDTTRLITYNYYAKEFSNPADTAVGYSHGLFFLPDTTKIYSAYDGNAIIDAYENSKAIVIDSCKVYRFPFRNTHSFFMSTKNIIKYALTSNDSLLTEFHDFGDSLLFNLTIYSDKLVVVYYSSKPAYFENTYGPEEKINKYSIWINKSTGLPYKFKTTFSNSFAWEEYSDLQINKMDIKDFIPSRYIPADYEILFRGQETTTVTPIDLTGKKAPDWTLSDSNNESFSLQDFKSQVLVIQFSGIGCPPCHASLPFLKQLIADYENKSFELVRVECWNNNIDAIKSYCTANDIKYKFLIIDNEIQKNYNVLAVPTFFILDNNKVIQKVVRGYSSELEKEIKEAIEKIL